MKRMLISLCAAGLVLVVVPPSVAAEWSWQDPKAKVLPTGDLDWAPHAFSYQHGESVRYIDFREGTDSNDGLTQATPWKHHPWDPAATRKAAACEGIHTYVFKGGVAYRGQLIVDESGTVDAPVRLTSDPSWGEGQAILCGSEPVSGWTMGTSHPDIPDGERVAWVDLDFAPRCVWLLEDKERVVRIPLARTPNWNVSNPDDIKSEWWAWDLPDDPWGAREKLGNTEYHLGIDTQHITKSADYYEGALIWPEYGWVMSTPYPTPVLKCDPERHALLFGGQWGGGAGSYHVPRHARYYLEDKPHYLDSPGEFWFEKKKEGGRLYLRLPADRDPNNAHIEVARRLNLIDSKGMQHVHIAGLTFRFTNVFWNLDAPPTRGEDVDPACIRLLGSGKDIVVANCRFEHVNAPIRMKAVGDDAVIDRVVIRDNVMRYTDQGAIWIADGGDWGMEFPKGRLFDVKIVRNALFQIGRRPTRYRHGHAIEIDCSETAEIAGNIGTRLYGSGIFVYGGKRSAAKVDRPLSRILIHHNEMVDTLLNSNDWGGIETWQGGPAYVFNNISANPRGFKTWGHLLQSDKPATSSFGHAYYMDGGYKQYYFNNIAWGKSNDPFGPLGNCSAFQEIHGFLAMIFNNTAYNFIIGSRRQAPEAGRNKYLGNVWYGLGEMVFRHANPSNTMADPNAADAGKQQSEFHHESNAYASNLFFDVPKKFGVFEPDGHWHPDADSFRRGLKQAGSIGDLGQTAAVSPLRDPAKGDFRPAPEAEGHGVRVFVPWGLYATVAEWPFYHAGDDATNLLDEHFHLAPYYVNREDYRKQPMYPLRAVNVKAEDFIDGPLEDWTRGALRLNGRDQFAVWRNDAVGTIAESDPVEIQNKPAEWIRFETPDSITPGEPCEVRIYLKGKGIDPSLKLRADLHWSRSGGRFGGMNAWGGDAKPISGEGPYRFRFQPTEKPGLVTFTVTAWLTPSGDWGDQKEIARFTIPRASTASGSSYKSPQVGKTNFLLEAYVQTTSHEEAVLLEKMGDAGYSLVVNDRGGVTFAVKGGASNAEVRSRSQIDDGRWHHVLAEADRGTRTLTLYLDGHRDASGTGIGPDVDLATEADLYVGGTPHGRCMEGVFEFARVALGTLSDAKTTIEELHAWQFDGPFLRDWNGHEAKEGERSAGAIDFE